MTNNLILPREDELGVPYISYSQLNKWKTNRREYIRQYFFKEPFDGNAYTEFGNKVGEALEHYNFKGFTVSETEFLKTVPRYDEFERKVMLKMKGFYVLGFIDSNTYERGEYISASNHKGEGEIGSQEYFINNILDYKTGDVVTKKEEYESDKYNQLEIYAAALQQETGYLPESAKVVLIDRKGNAFKGERLKLGREFITITKELTQERIDSVLQDVQETAEEISAYYKVFLKLTQ